MNKKKVAFICVHNSCRSQIAEALGRHLASDVFESYSAGTETKPQINQDAVRLMKELYGIDMEAEGQYSKRISDIPTPDLAISMGCNVECPFIGRPFDENWGLQDPTGGSEETFREVIAEIEKNILKLRGTIGDGEDGLVRQNNGENNRAGNTVPVDTKEKLYQQLAIDYCCPISNIKDNKNCFTEYKKLEGRRRFEEADDCILKVIVVNGKLVFTGKKQVVDVCRQKFSNKSGSWFMDVSNFRELDEILAGEKYQIKTVHPFFIPRDNHVCEMNGIEVKKYNQEEILQFKGDDRFDEAFCFSENSPDVLAVAAVVDHEIVGMAGASADSPYFWQIGINVNKEFEGRNIGSGLVSILKYNILQKGIVPYYGTSFSNLASQHVAIRAGFEVAWVELITEKIL